MADPTKDTIFKLLTKEQRAKLSKIRGGELRNKAMKQMLGPDVKAKPTDKKGEMPESERIAKFRADQKIKAALEKALENNAGVIKSRAGNKPVKDKKDAVQK